MDRNMRHNQNFMLKSFSGWPVGEGGVMDLSWQERSHWFAINRNRMFVAGGVALLTGLGAAMVATNPTPADYEQFATQQLVAYLDREVCLEAPVAFNLRQQCKSFLKANRSQLRTFIADNTSRRNFILFSLYSTELSVASFVPTYQVESVGIFDRFFIYQTTQE
jgi:hypothetical protein